MTSQSSADYHDKYSRDMTVTTLLGVSLPVDEVHAVSVSLPKWAHVVGYEEGREDVTTHMRCGYPRFRFNDAVLWLFTVLKCSLYLQEHVKVLGVSMQQNQHGSEGTLGQADCVHITDICLACYAVPGYAVALRLRQFLLASEVPQDSVSVYRLLQSGVFCVFFPVELAARAKAYWQHSGEVSTGLNSIK